MARIKQIRTRSLSGLVAAVALVTCAFALFSPAAQARPSVDEATQAYVGAVGPALERFGKVADDVDTAITKAKKRSDSSNAAVFGALAKRIEKSEVRLDRIEPPKQFAKPHGAYVKAVARLASDVGLVARAARKKDEKAATTAGFRLGRTVKALNKADKALGLALQRVAAPGDAASLSREREKPLSRASSERDSPARSSSG